MGTTANSVVAWWLPMVIFGVFFIIGIIFLYSQQSVLRTIKTESRSMRPGLVWLQLIPIFGQIWQFIVVTKIAGSIRKEIASWEADSFLGAEAVLIEKGVRRPTLGIGITYCTLIVVGFGLHPDIWGNPVLPRALLELIGWTELAGIICWIVYWVKLTGYKKKLREKNLATL